MHPIQSGKQQQNGAGGQSSMFSSISNFFAPAEIK
jgi:hypothetical protein